jgi:hypothetical protein
VNAASGNGFSRLGPDIVPYSDTQLMTAFRSPYFLGLQLWNEDTRVVTDPEDGAFPMAGWAGGRWGRKDEQGQKSALHHGAAAWDRMLLWGLNPSLTFGLDWLPPGTPRRVFMAGGSDAHGDLNFRQEGAVTGWSAATDTAIGKPRNLLYVPSMDNGIFDPGIVEGLTATQATAGETPGTSKTPPVTGVRATSAVAPGRLPTRLAGGELAPGAPVVAAVAPKTTPPASAPPQGPAPWVSARFRWNAELDQTQVVDAFRSGHFSVTDGPALRIALDTNGNGVVDGADVPMGGTAELSRAGLTTVLVEWKSTAEFGPVTSIDLYVGSQAGNLHGAVWAPLDHGVRGPTDPSGTLVMDIPGPGGRLFRRLQDGYFLPSSGTLRITVPAAEGMRGVRRIVLSRADYPIVETECHVEESWTPAQCTGEGIHRHCTKPIKHERTVCVATSVTPAERLYVRAFARTASSIPAGGGALPLERYAYTNPIWLHPGPFDFAVAPIGGSVLSR